MFSVSSILVPVWALTLGLCLTACGTGAAGQPVPEASEPPAQGQETPGPVPGPSQKTPESEMEVTEGTEFYRGFRMDNVLHAPEGDIHYHIYIPDSYDGSEACALFLTLPGYEGLYFQGMGQNLYREEFAFEALRYSGDMIVAAPQLNDWGETSAEQTIVLTEYLLEHYAIDRERVYAEGYSGGGETMPDMAPTCCWSKRRGNAAPARRMRRGTFCAGAGNRRRSVRWDPSAPGMNRSGRRPACVGSAVWI